MKEKVWNKYLGYMRDYKEADHKFRLISTMGAYHGPEKYKDTIVKAMADFAIAYQSIETMKWDVARSVYHQFQDPNIEIRNVDIDTMEPYAHMNMLIYGDHYRNNKDIEYEYIKDMLSKCGAYIKV